MYQINFEEEQIIECEGKIIFDPKAIADPSGKMFKPWWVIVALDKDDEFGQYYSWFYEKQHGIKLQRPAFGAHISVIRGEETDLENWQKFKELYHKKPIKFTCDISPRTNGMHVWLRVKCDELKDLREQMGYERDGRWGLHLTLGMPVQLHLERNYVIWRMYQSFGRDC